MGSEVGGECELRDGVCRRHRWGTAGQKHRKAGGKPLSLLMKKEAGLDLGLYQLAERLPKMHKTPGSMPCIA